MRVIQADRNNKPALYCTRCGEFVVLGKWATGEDPEINGGKPLHLPSESAMLFLKLMKENN